MEVYIIILYNIPMPIPIPGLFTGLKMVLFCNFMPGSETCSLQ